MATVSRSLNSGIESNKTLRRFAVQDRFAVTTQSEWANLDLWYPVVPDTPYQRVLDISIKATVPWRLTREAEHGNLMIYAHLTRPLSPSLEFGLHYVVERMPLTTELDPACVRSLGAPTVFAPYLRAEQFVNVNEKTRALAHEIIGDEENLLKRARKIYDYVAGTMTYDAQKQSWKGSTEHALACSVGNCNDIHALFISLCRSIGSPARLVLGQAFEPPPPGGEACDLCGYHCWAEFFVPGLGWLPADASCACKYAKRGLFGDLETNHVAWSVGRDILLEPPQRGDRVLFFAGPYIEVDGQPHRAIERHIHFEEL